MRMHRKSHLDERLISCGDILTLADLSDKNMSSAAQKKEYLDLAEIFKNSHSVHLEIGCGKGKFVIESAAAHPEINFVAIEKVSNVIITACEDAAKLNLSNVHFINSSAEVLEKYFKENTFERIYLNFSNPLPKQGYARQRLTNPKFLEIYGRILKEGGEIWQKTDNESFFDYSVESFLSSGYQLKEVCRDITKQPFEGNVITEHEQKFMDMGLPIFRLVAVKK